MRYRYIGFIFLILSILITPTMAMGGISVTPTKLNGGGGSVTIYNTGDVPLSYTVTTSQIMLKDGQQILYENVNTDIQYSESTFRLAPGESKTIQVTVGNTNNKLYGVTITGMPEDGQVKMGVSMTIKIDTGGQPETVNDRLSIYPKYLPVTLSGMPISINYNIVNTGNMPHTYGDKVYYPGDSGSVVKEYPTGFMDMGFKDCDGNSVFIIPSWLVIVVLIGGAVFVLRRKVDVKLK